MEPGVRRALLLGVCVLAASVPVTAHAQAGPTFSSPSTAPAGAPMFIRSETPCPALGAGATHRWAYVWTVDATTGTQGPAANGEVRADGSWDVSLTAPAGAPGGATTYWLVDAECAENAPQVSQSAGDVTQSYSARDLRVTSGTGAAATRPGAPTTTTAAPSTTTTTTTTTAASAAATTATTVAAAVSLGATSAEDVEREIAASKVAASPTEDGVALAASPTASQRREPVDGGIPGWAFLCAASLAVGAVIAWGARRSVFAGE